MVHTVRKRTAVHACAPLSSAICIQMGVRVDKTERARVCLQNCILDTFLGLEGVLKKFRVWYMCTQVMNFARILPKINLWCGKIVRKFLYNFSNWKLYMHHSERCNDKGMPCKTAIVFNSICYFNLQCLVPKSDRHLIDPPHVGQPNDIISILSSVLVVLC
jgi:hypothetical protein